MERRQVIVTCALIVEGNRVLAARRSPAMRHPGKWEFPGGKLEPGEEPIQCIEREILEELGIEVVVTGSLSPSLHSYPDLDLELLPYLCKWVGGELRLDEHDKAEWFLPEHLRQLDWAEADLPVVEEWLSLLDSEDSKLLSFKT
jgi:8-oxo-dGTP diphosphatase